MKSPGEREAEALSLLGLAARAGVVAKGTEAARRAVRNRDARVVILARDAAGAQRRKIVDLLRHNSVPYVTLAERAGLGAAVGGPPLSAVAVTNVSFAERILRDLPREEAD